MCKIAERRVKEKRGPVNFEGKACWVGVDVHKVNYAVAVLDEDGQRLEFSTPAQPKKLLLQLANMGMTINALVYESGPPTRFVRAGPSHHSRPLPTLRRKARREGAGT
jgi:hypothetical protein